MPSMQQADLLKSDYHRLMDSTLDESFSRTGTDSESLMSITELLGLNMPRGSLVGSSQGPGTRGQESVRATPPLYMGSPTRPFSGDDSGYHASPSGSPLPQDMSTPGKSAPIRRGRLDSVGTFSPASPSPAASPQGPFCPSSPSSRPYRAGSQTISESGSGIDHAYIMNSRSNSPDSVNSLDNNLSDLMNCLYLHSRTRSDSGLSTGMPSTPDDHRQQELTNLTNLHTLQLQSLSNNNQPLHLYQHNQQLQSPLGSPVASPLASPEKLWSPGSLPGSLPNSLPGSPLFTSSPLRGLAPSTPPSPGSGHVMRMSCSLDSSSRYQRSPMAHCDATCTWSGTLPARSLENPTFSVKVFLGGVPWDMNDAMLANGLKQFGSGAIRVEWPLSKQPGVPPPKGYVYVIFDCEKQVKALLQACSYDFSNGGGNWYFKISSKRMKAKEVQVIPWTTNDANWVRSPSQKLDPGKTVFVGGLHGMLNAHGLAKIMNDLFGGVVYAGIDTDKFKYPIGSARVTFNSNRSFLKAVNSRFIEIKADKFSKKVQVDPYLEDSPCSLCSVQHGPYFCRESSCFRYFCRSCWHWRHAQDSWLVSHSALMRTSKSHNGVTGVTDVGMGCSMNMGIPARREQVMGGTARREQFSSQARYDRMLRLSLDNVH